MTRVKWARQQLRTVMLWEFFVLCFIIAQSDSRNREYLVSWLQKISLEHLRELWRSLQRDFFTNFVHVSILCLRSYESSQEQGIILLE